MTTYYFLLVDGRCTEIKSKTYEQALTDACDKFGYDDYLEFVNDLNFGEWKTSDGVRTYKNYRLGTMQKFLPGFPGNEYQLKSLTKTKPIKKPAKQLRDEWEEELV